MSLEYSGAHRAHVTSPSRDSRTVLEEEAERGQGGLSEVVSFGLDSTTAQMNSQQLWGSSQELCKTKPTRILALSRNAFTGSCH